MSDPGASSRVVRNSAILFSGEMLARLLGAAYHVILARHLGMELFGEFTWVLALAAILGMGSDLGLANLTAREVSRSRERPWTVLNRALRARAATAVVLGVVAVLLCVLSGRGGNAVALVGILAATQLVQGQGEVLAAAHRGREQVGAPVLVGVICRTGLVISGVAAVLLGGSLITLAVLTTIWALPLPLALAPRLPGPRKSEASAADALGFLRTAAPIGLGAALWAFYFRVDLLVLGFLQGDAAVGRYGAAFRIVEAVLLIQGPLLAAAFPLLASRGPADREYREAFRMVFRLLTLMGMGLAALITLEAGPLLNSMFGPEYASSETALRILGPTIPISFLAAPFLTLLICRDRERKYVVIMAAAALLNPLLDLLLIGRWGIEGAAAATLATEVLVVMLALMISRRADSPPGAPATILRALIAGILFGGVLHLARIAGIPFPLRAGAGMILVYPAFALATGALARSDLVLLSRAIRGGKQGR